MDKFSNKYRIPSARLKNYDYGSNGFYFVTICTKNKINYFGTVVETDNYPSLQGNEEQNEKIDNYPSLQDNEEQNEKIDQYPSLNKNTNIFLQKTEIAKIAINFWEQIPQHFPFVELDEFVLMPNHLHGIIFINKSNYNEFKPNIFGTQSQNLASIIRAYKASVKRYANQNKLDLFWQSSYYENVIRNEKQLIYIRNYIENNLLNWHLDELYIP